MAITLPATPANGDTFTSDGNKYQYNGTAWVRVPSTTAVVGMTGSEAGCRFTRTSDTACKLSPYLNNIIQINGRVEQIPNAGVTLSNSGLTAATLYYV